MKRVVVVNGPNLNLLGTREPHIYGTRSLKDLEETVRSKAKSLDLEVIFYQSNHEGALIDFLQKQAPGSARTVIHPAELTPHPARPSSRAFAAVTSTRPSEPTARRRPTPTPTSRTTTSWTPRPTTRSRSTRRCSSRCCRC